MAGGAAGARGAAYAAIGWRCWFWIPNTGIAIATACFTGAALGVWLT